jgi:hypothetical protein
MECAMREYDVLETLVTKFEPYIAGMDEIATGKEPIAQTGNEKLFLKIFTCGNNKENPLKKISFMRLEDGNIKNKDDKSSLDPGEFTVITFISNDDFPLPLCAMEASFHFDKYIQGRVDLPPLASTKEYRETFCKPVQELREKIDGLPGLAPLVSLPGLEDFSSGGLMTGHFGIQNKDAAMKCFFDYADLYLTFLNQRKDYALLKDPAILEEGREKRSAFCQMFAKMTPRILSDIPNLYSDELAKKLGEMLF